MWYFYNEIFTFIGLLEYCNMRIRSLPAIVLIGPAPSATGWGESEGHAVIVPVTQLKTFSLINIMFHTIAFRALLRACAKPTWENDIAQNLSVTLQCNDCIGVVCLFVVFQILFLPRDETVWRVQYICSSNLNILHSTDDIFRTKFLLYEYENN